jgi:hypothetical protein
MSDQQPTKKQGGKLKHSTLMPKHDDHLVINVSLISCLTRTPTDPSRALPSLLAQLYRRGLGLGRPAAGWRRPLAAATNPNGLSAH